MDITIQIESSDAEDEASVKVDRRKKSRMQSRKPKNPNALSKQKNFILHEIMNAWHRLTGEPIKKRYGFIHAKEMSYKFKYCTLPPFRTKIGLKTHLTDDHGMNSDEESEGEDLEDQLMKRSSSRRNIPIHLDYREEESSEEELGDDEVEVQVIEIDDDEELLTSGQKRDAVSAGLLEPSSSSSKKIQKMNQSITLRDINSRGSIEKGASASDQNNNQFIDKTMEDFLKM